MITTTTIYVLSIKFDILFDILFDLFFSNIIVMSTINQLFVINQTIINSILKNTLFNEITIYDSFEIIDKIVVVVNEFSQI